MATWGNETKNSSTFGNVSKSDASFSKQLLEIGDGFNLLMSEVNLSSQVFYSNYSGYTDIVEYEGIIESKNSISNQVTLYDTIPFVIGAIIIFKNIFDSIKY